MSKRGAFAATAFGLAAVLLACASKIAAPTPYRFTALDPALRVDELQGDQVEELAVDGATLQQSCYDDALRRGCAIQAFWGHTDGGPDACSSSLASCVASPPEIDGGTFFALTHGAPIQTAQCTVTVGELAACILDQQRELHEWLGDPCSTSAKSWGPAIAASCSAVTSNPSCAFLISELVPDLCGTPVLCSY